MKRRLTQFLLWVILASISGCGGCCGAPFSGERCGLPYSCKTDQDCQSYFQTTRAFCAQPGGFCALSADAGSADGGGIDGGFTDGGAPTFVVTVESPSRDGGIDVDPVTPSAWRRDELATIDVRSSDPGVDPTSVTVTVFGTDGVAAPSTPVTANTGCGSAYCGKVQVDLAAPTLHAFRASLAVTVTGRGASGLTGTASATISITRWKWAQAVPNGDVITGDPAIGSQGTIYLGTVPLGGLPPGTTYAVEPSGSLLWAFDGGSVWGTAAVGGLDAGTEIVYVTTSDNAGCHLFALRGTDGNVVLSCTSASANCVYSTAATTVAMSGATREAGIGLLDGPTALIVADPDGGCFPATFSLPLQGAASSGRLSIDPQNNLYFGDTVNVQSVSLQPGGAWALRDGGGAWPVAPPLFHGQFVNIINDLIAITGSTLVGGGANALFSIPTSGGGTQWLYPSSSTVTTSSPVIGAGNRIYVTNSNGVLTSIQLDAALPLATTDAGTVLGSPTLGADGTVYATDFSSGRLNAWDAQLNPLWSMPSVARMKLGGSPTLDCARDSSGTKLAGRPGLLYVTSLGSSPIPGMLFAVVVDSRGIDTTAPWPVYQHDPRATGNAATSLAEFACP